MTGARKNKAVTQPKETPQKFNIEALLNREITRPHGVLLSAIRTFPFKEEQEKESRPKVRIALFDTVIVQTPEGALRGRVVSTTKGFCYVLTAAGTFVALKHSLRKASGPKMRFDLKNLPVPGLGSLVNVRDSNGHLVRRFLAGPLSEKGKITLLKVRPGRADARVEYVDRSRIVGVWMPERFPNGQGGYTRTPPLDLDIS